MPLLKPEIQSALRLAGIGGSDGDDKQDIESILNDNNLSLRDSVRILSEIAHSSTNEHTRKGAVETAFKLLGVMKEGAAQIPSVTIIINDPKGGDIKINPILIPREITTNA